MYGCTSELFLCNDLTCYGLNDCGTGQEHVACALGHDIEVGKGGRVNGTSGAGTEDG